MALYCETIPYIDVRGNYNDYSKSDRWKAIKEYHFSKAHNKYCRACGKRDNLQIHHKSYSRLYKFGETKDLVTLCAYHHKMVHTLSSRGGIPLKDATNEVIRVNSSKVTPKEKKSKPKRKKTNNSKVNQILNKCLLAYQKYNSNKISEQVFLEGIEERERILRALNWNGDVMDWIKRN